MAKLLQNLMNGINFNYSPTVQTFPQIQAAPTPPIKHPGLLTGKALPLRLVCSRGIEF